MSNTKFFSLLLVGGFLVLGFQNCGDGFQALNSASLDSRGGGGGTLDGQGDPAEIVPTAFTQTQVESCISLRGAANLVACLDTNQANPLGLTQAEVNTCRTNVGNDEPRALAICLAKNEFAPAGYRDPSQIDINQCNEVVGEERLAVCLYNNGVLAQNIGRADIDDCVANVGVGRVEACLRKKDLIDDEQFMYQAQVNDCSVIHGDNQIADCLKGRQLVPQTVTQVDVQGCIKANPNNNSSTVARCLRMRERVPVVFHQPMVNRCVDAVGATAIATCLEAQGLLLEGVTQAEINTCITNGQGATTGVVGCLRTRGIISNRPLQKNFEFCNRLAGSTGLEGCLRGSGLLLPMLTAADFGVCLANNEADDVTGIENCLRTRGFLASWSQLVAAGGALNGCLNCHGANGPRAGLRLSVYQNPFTSNSGRTIADPDNVAGSEVVIRTNNAGNPMPPNGLLPQAQRDLIRRWVAQGAIENYE